MFIKWQEVESDFLYIQKDSDLLRYNLASDQTRLKYVYGLGLVLGQKPNWTTCKVFFGTLKKIVAKLIENRFTFIGTFEKSKLLKITVEQSMRERVKLSPNARVTQFEGASKPPPILKSSR